MIDLQGIVDTLLTHASRSSAFDVIMSHEPRNAPSGKWTFAAWLNQLDPIPTRSGLASMSVRAEFLVRLYCPYVGPAADDLNAMDSDMAMRIGLLWSAYCGDLEFTTADHELDALGAYGERLRMRAGFATFQNTPYRIGDVFIPLVIDDAFTFGRTEGSD